MVADPLSTSSQVTAEYTPSSLNLKSTEDDYISQLPLQWEGYLRKKAEWLPRWDIYFVVLDGRQLSCYEKSDIDYHVDFTASNSFTLPLSCITRANTTSHIIISKDIEANSSTLSSLKPREVHQIASFETESNGKSDHRLIITTSEKRVLQFMTNVPLEFVVWKQMLQCALSRRKKRAGHAGKGRSATIADVATQEAGGASCYGHPSVCPVTTNTQTTHSYYTVDLAVMYEAYGDICRRVGQFSLVLPCLHPLVMITSNYPSSTPMAGTYVGVGIETGFLRLLQIIHQCVDVSQYCITHIARDGDLAVISGNETITNLENHRRYRQMWRHEVRFGADGRMSHIHIVCDVTATTCAFTDTNTQVNTTKGRDVRSSKKKDGRQNSIYAFCPLSLPHEKEIVPNTCPPGKLRVVCIAAELYSLHKQRHAAGFSKHATVTFTLWGGSHHHQSRRQIHPRLKQWSYSTRSGTVLHKSKCMSSCHRCCHDSAYLESIFHD
jgi:hypothetical protein